MIVTPNSQVDRHGFRLRDTSGSRIDSFSDVVFGFALTLLVVSQAVPETYEQLRSVLLGFLPFAICFLIFVSVWMEHYRFFRRYGAHDFRTIWINFALLFVVLFYTYPLKFLFTFADSAFREGGFNNTREIGQLMVVYGAGFAAIQFCLAALYGNAFLQRRKLHLNPVEVTVTTAEFWHFIGSGAVGLICCGVALLLPHDKGRAGYSFFLLFPWRTGHANVMRRHLRAAVARTTPEEQLAVPEVG